MPLKPNKIKRPWESKQSQQRDRTGKSDLYHTRRWRKLRAYLLRIEPLCRECKKQGKIVLAKIADHIIPEHIYEGDFFDLINLQPLCVSCHAKKSREEGKK
jgi:5-methylcytosine-specific restriction protein A